jgi:hypothetical protein
MRARALASKTTPHTCDLQVMELMVGGELFDRIVEKSKYSEVRCIAGCNCRIATDFGPSLLLAERGCRCNQKTR